MAQREMMEELRAARGHLHNDAGPASYSDIREDQSEDPGIPTGGHYIPEARASADDPPCVRSRYVSPTASMITAVSNTSAARFASRFADTFGLGGRHVVSQTF